LLERARVHVRESGVANVEFVCADAATQCFERPFDAAFSRFGIMFFDDPLTAFHNLRVALRSGGRLGFVCWQSAGENPWASVPLDALRAVAPEQPLPESLAPGGPGPFAFADAEFVRSVLDRAGFTATQVRSHQTELHLGGAQSLADAVDFLLDIGPAARFASEAAPSLLPRFREALLESLAPYASPRGVWMPGRTWVVTANSASALSPGPPARRRNQ
jgi:SAM-dependent methyltransferase